MTTETQPVAIAVTAPGPAPPAPTPIVITQSDWHFLLVANIVAMGIALVSAKYALGWKAASASVVISSLMLGYFCLRHPEPLFARLLVFGLAIGFTELLNDTWLIDKSILIYDPGGPFIIDTPLYMPFCWALIFVTNGTIAVWLFQKLNGGIKAALAMALLSGMYIPGFEALAAKAFWWHYENVSMFFGLAPNFVVLGEALLALPLPLMCVTLARRHFGVSVGLGIVEGLVVWATTVLSLAVVH
jgi:hypothetical protein